MPVVGVYTPEDHTRFQPFEEECDAVDQMAEQVAELTGVGLSPTEAFYQAFARTHPSPFGHELFVNPDELFYLMSKTMVPRARGYYDNLRDKYLSPVGLNLRPHNAAKNPVNPLRLLHVSQHGVERVGPKLREQVCWEAKRLLATAFGFLTMELAHPESWISQEVERIELLSSRHLFAPADLADVYVVYAVDRNSSGRVIGTPFVTLDERLARRVRRRPYDVLPRGGQIFTHHFQCRTIVGPGGVRWLVEYDDRVKTYDARLLKLHDGGSNRDSCGTSQVVVARLDADGNLALGTRDDVEAVLALTQERLWGGPDLMPFTVAPGGPKRQRHPDYYDRKLVGRIVMDLDGRRVHAFVEQILTSLTDYLHQLRATDALNHEIRRGEQLAIRNPEKERAPPAWRYWPEHIYTKVAWASDETVRILRRWWAMRFAERVRKA